MHQRGTGAGQVPQLPDRFGRDERTMQQIMCGQLGQPGRIVHVGFPSRDVPGLPRIDQHHRQLARHQVVEGLPVVAGRFHHHSGNLLVFQIVNQREDLLGRRAEGEDRGRIGSLALARFAHGDLDVSFGDVHAGGALMQHVHDRFAFFLLGRCTATISGVGDS